MMGFLRYLKGEATIIQQQYIALLYILQQLLGNIDSVLIAQLWIHLAIQSERAAFTELNFLILSKTTNPYFWPLHIAENTHWCLELFTYAPNRLRTLSMLLSSAVGEVEAKDVDAGNNQVSYSLIMAAAWAKCGQNLSSAGHRITLVRSAGQCCCRACDWRSPIHCHTRP